MGSRPGSRHRTTDLAAVADTAIIETRMDAVVELVAEGLPVPEVATRLGIHPETVRKDFKRAMLRTREHTDLGVQAYRDKQIAELDALKGILWAKVQDGQVTAMDRYLACMKHEADLLGLRAPVKIAQTDKDGNDRYANPDYDAAFAALADALAASRAPRTDDAPGSGGANGAPEVHVAGVGAAEPVTAEWELADVADPRGSRLREDQDHHGDGAGLD